MFVKRRKSQVSMEYLITVGIALALLLPLIVFSYKAYNDYQDQMFVSIAEQSVAIIANTAEELYFIGPPSMQYLDVTIPQNVFAINITNSTVLFRIQTARGIHDVSADAGVQLKGTMLTRPGTYRVLLISKGSYVQVN